MPGLTNDFSRLMKRAAEGDANAFTELFHLYNPTLLAQLRSRLKKNRCLRSLLDAEDLAQDIWVGFFGGPLRRLSFPTPDRLRRYLARMARNQVRKVVRNHLCTQKRDARRHQILSEASAGAAIAVVADPLPPPSQTAEVRDYCEKWFASLPDKQQKMAHMIGVGFSHTQIAEKLGCSRRSFERMGNGMLQALSPV